MKINKNTQIDGEKIILVPYERKHVLKYHAWMKSEELQLLTASEPLTLDQEYEMQESWRNDENKCTFIVLDKKMLEMGNQSEIDCMVGDVNLFFNDPDNLKSAEIEIMIAEPSARGRGIGKESLCSMLRYGFENLSVMEYTAKIGYNNQTSLNLFEKLGFCEVSRSEFFQEVTLRLDLSDSMKDSICAATKSYKTVPYIDDSNHELCVP